MSPGMGFGGSKSQARPRISHFLLRADVDLSAPPAPSLPTCYHISCHDDNGLKLSTVRQPQLNVFFLCKSAMVMVPLHSKTGL